MKTYKITYYQTFNGEHLVDSYTRTVNDFEELMVKVGYLYEDPHVTDIKWEEIK